MVYQGERMIYEQVTVLLTNVGGTDKRYKYLGIQREIEWDFCNEMNSFDNFYKGWFKLNSDDKTYIDKCVSKFNLHQN